MMIELCRRYKFRLHIVHLSTARALPMVRAAKMEGLPITVETCPHYLHFAAEEISDGNTLAKCAPPIRSAENREALWEALREGVIDLIATDHSPCLPEMKRLDEGRFDLAWGGIACLSVALPVIWTEAQHRGFAVEDVARWMSVGPAKLAGMSQRAGAIAVGREANFVVFDPDAQFEVNPERLHFRHAVLPYVGTKLKGVVEATYLRGEPVWSMAGFDSRVRGRELRLC